jgi:hypothetical protein
MLVGVAGPGVVAGAACGAGAGTGAGVTLSMTGAVTRGPPWPVVAAAGGLVAIAEGPLIEYEYQRAPTAIIAANTDAENYTGGNARLGLRVAVSIHGRIAAYSGIRKRGEYRSPVLTPELLR